MKKRAISWMLTGAMALSMASGFCVSASAEETTGELIDVLNQEETMKLAVVCLQGYTTPDSETEKWMEERSMLFFPQTALIQIRQMMQISWHIPYLQV